MNRFTHISSFRAAWRQLLLGLTLSALLAACAGAPAPPEVTPSAPAPQATQPAAAATAEDSFPQEENLPQEQAVPAEQEDLYNRWYTPVVATMYPFLICQSNIADLTGSETGDTRGQAAALIANRANAGREVLAYWEPPEEHQQIRTDALAYLNLMIELSRQWYQEEIDGAAFREQMDAACAGAEGLLKDTAYLAREEGLTMETMQAISDRFEQALANP
ncbi:MAG: hypothetical protein ACK2UW_09305 [Anaerolineales bacterium]